jgi:hypothetical protein
MRAPTDAACGESARWQLSHQKFTVARKTGGGFCVGILWDASQNKHTLLISFPCVFRTVFREFWWFHMNNWMVRR